MPVGTGALRGLPVELLLQRTRDTDTSTGGILTIDGIHHCFTCEDEHRDVKVPGKTRIPAGTYKIELRKAGGMSTRYADKFPWHEGMLHLQDVENFSWVYIHIGNTDKHTAGCILVGYGALWRDSCVVTNSTEAYETLYKLVVESLSAGESVYITIKD